MALVVKDRVQETSTTTGTGSLTLSGAVTGFQTFSSAIGNTNTTYYTIQNGSEWEVGIGTVSAGALSRDTVLESSNSGSLVNFSAGIKYVFCTYPAEKSVDIETAQTLTNKTLTNPTINGFTGNTSVINVGSGQIYKDTSGNVGIGTSSLTQKLTVNGNVQANNVYFGNATSAGGTLASDNTGTNSYISLLGSTSSPASVIALGNNGTERMRIDASGSLGIGSTNPSSYGKLTVNGAIAQVAAAGSYTIDVTANSSSVANGGTIDFPNMSGMIIVNSATSASIAIWLVSGGSTSAVSNVNGATGTMTYVSGIAGYRWTNNTGSANTVAFFCVRTRGTA